MRSFKYASALNNPDTPKGIIYIYLMVITIDSNKLES